ncbi:helix-turn-helix domain-containing protein [Microbacterium sp. BG28]|uniref:helix-turn-helix domain-containing protein n=1 Tax=Microbacterium sp. BG28 TaxID=3097356 RepID=UPI002A5B108D|nr:helix-turn-helix domain-containing protein [Microbacterium sp. BG28]MDY0830704.1 helix-turn-helix domain-containing protein [Microbacterium sp. BG28]
MYTERALPDGSALWRSTGGAGGAVPADGCVDLILLADHVYVAGPSTRWIAAVADPANGSFGLRLSPGRAHGLLAAALPQLTDRLVPLAETVAADEARRLRERMVRFGDGPHPIAGLVEIASRADVENVWSRAVQVGARRAVSAARVAAEMNETERTFRRRMRERFGYGYATLVRIERARRARQLLQGDRTLADVAAAAGYADQSHLTREFRRLVGASPAQFASSAA